MSSNVNPAYNEIHIRVCPVNVASTITAHLELGWKLKSINKLNESYSLCIFYKDHLEKELKSKPEKDILDFELLSIRNSLLLNDENVRIKCDSLFYAIKLMQYASYNNLKWINDKEMTPDNTYWEIHQENTFYNLFKGQFSNDSFVDPHIHKIIDVKEFLKLN